MSDFYPCLALLGSIALWSAPLHAQDPSPTQIAQARALAEEGITLAEKNDCPGAIEKLARADQLYKAPTILVSLGECRVKLGKLVLGTENLRSALLLPDQGRAPFVEAQQRARKILDQALPKIASIHLQIRLPRGVSPRVSLDGEVLPEAGLTSDIPADPGAHTVEVAAPGYLPERRSLTLPEGGKQTLDIEPKLAPDPCKATPPAASCTPPPSPSAPGNATSSAPLSSPTAPPGEPSAGRRYATYGLLTAGAVGLVAGGIFALRVQSKKDELDGTCTNKRCPISSESIYEAGRTSATFSTVGFGLGLGATAVGLYLLFSEPDTQRSASTRSPRVGLGTAGTLSGLSLSGGF